MAQVKKKHIKNAYPYIGYETKHTIIIYQLQVHNIMTCYMKNKIIWYNKTHKFSDLLTNQFLHNALQFS